MSDTEKDYWLPDSSGFVHFGKVYCVNRAGYSVCAGTVGEYQDKERHKEEHKDDGITTPTGIMQQTKARGRPPKQGDVCRTTEWRRKQRTLAG